MRSPRRPAKDPLSRRFSPRYSQPDGPRYSSRPDGPRYSRVARPQFRTAARRAR